MYKIIALIGEAGTGKDTLMKEFLKQHDFHEIISCTTRPPREGEKNGVNYFYYSEKDFLEKVNKNEMLEYTSFRDWLYGTSYDSVIKDKINIGVFNPDGYDCLIQTTDKDIRLIGFYIKASDKTRMLRQLNRETNPNVSEIVRRYSADEEDFIDVEYMPGILSIDNDNRDIQDVVSEIEHNIRDMVKLY